MVHIKKKKNQRKKKNLIWIKKRKTFGGKRDHTKSICIQRTRRFDNTLIPPNLFIIVDRYFNFSVHNPQKFLTIILYNVR